MASSSIRGATPTGILARGAAAKDSAKTRSPAVERGFLRAVPAAFGPAFAPVFSEGFRRVVALGEAFAYASGLAALVGAAMTWAVARALASSSAPRDAALVACGAFVIYSVDRLRDLARDRPDSPARTAFVLRHRVELGVATGLAGLVLIALLATAPTAILVLCLPVGAIGLLHRRLKGDARFKVAYVAAAWSAACVGLPWLGRDGAGEAARAGGLAGSFVGSFAWPLVFVGCGVTANLIASNLREGKRGAAGWAPEKALGLARAVAIAGLAAALIAPRDLAPLAAIPAAEAAALCGFRASERFAHLAVDGALLIGALAAWAARALAG